jgi:AraC family carnitine catabolism transcriptional activator
MTIGDQPRNAVILVHPGFGLGTMAGVLDMLFVANWLARRTLYVWTLASVEGGAVSAYNGLPIDTARLSDFAPRGADTVFVLASFDPMGLASEGGVSGFLRAAHRYGARIVGIETGGVALAKAGLLDGREAAIHWSNREGFEELFPDVALTDAPVAASGRRVTCAGGAAIPDLATVLITEDAGPDIARAVSAHLAARVEGEAGMADTKGSPLVSRTARKMAANLETPIPCHDLAAEAGVARRTLERRFVAQTGRTPGAYYLDLRLTRAQNLLQQTGLTVSEIAAETGFESLPAFSRAYRHRFGLAPSRDRAQTVVASVPRHPGL